jgi:UDP-N-acetylglucosamine 1-carboxyvinyltransferase
MPYPGFPTDLQAPMMALLARADGVSSIHETVFENRMMHVRELAKMGAQISVEGSTATIRGVEALYGASVIATDIRAAAALVVAGLSAEGTTHLSGVHHLTRGYSALDAKLRLLGASINAHHQPLAGASKQDESIV